MSDLKTKENDGDVRAFLETVENERRKQDSFVVLDIMEEITGKTPKMWGGSIIGFGNYHYTYDSGREGDWFVTGFSPRKQNLSLYIMGGFDEYEELLGKLGKHKTGKSCLYVNKLADVDMDVLKTLIASSVQHMQDTADVSDDDS